MYTAFTKEIDGIPVIIGLDMERLDPIRTNAKIKQLVETSKEYKAKKTRLQRINELSIANDSLFKQGRKIAERVASSKGKARQELKNEDFTSAEQNSLNGYNSRMIANSDEIKAVNAELPGLESNLKKKTAELQKKHGVFFELTNEYENRITDAQYTEYSKKLESIKGKKAFLCSDGSIIIDNRGKVFFGLVDNVWTKKEVKLLSDTIDSSFKLFEDLTDEEKTDMADQVEADRIVSLSNDDKQAEKEMMVSQAVREAANMRSELEIIGDGEALVKAQKFYQAELVKIEEKYK